MSTTPALRRVRQAAWRGGLLVLLCATSLQVFWLGRIALMAVVDPQSTSFQRSEIWRLLLDKRPAAWGQQWVDDAGLSPQLKRAVIASEDAGFTAHRGFEWDSVEKAWSRNQRAERSAPARPANTRPPKQVGGSTISQQLAKNLFLSGERTLPRKAQEAVITVALETFLSKRRILEIYLNNVEWGEGLFGAQAASQFYFGRDAARLDAASAARLAVMLPAPKRFERQFQSAYLSSRAATIVARMPGVELP